MSKSKPYSRIRCAKIIAPLNAISYLHPTKGWRWRTFTLSLAMGLSNAGKLA